MNGKAKGTRNEHRSMAILEASGYRCTRAAASLGAWDIVGIGLQDIMLCQVKTRDWPGSVEMKTLRAFVCPANARKIVHRWRARRRVPDVKELLGVGDIGGRIQKKIQGDNPGQGPRIPGW
jgi:hypothetical protein